MGQPLLLYFYALRFVQKMKLYGSLLTTTIRLRARIADTKSVDLARTSPTVSEFLEKFVWKPMGNPGSEPSFLICFDMAHSCLGDRAFLTERRKC